MSGMRSVNELNSASSAGLKKQNSYMVDDMTNRALADYPVQCVQRVNGIQQAELHSHHGYEWYFCLAGSGEFIAGDQAYGIFAGSLIIVRPSVLHMPRPANGQLLHRQILSVDERYLDRLCGVDRFTAEQVCEWLPDGASASVLWQLNTGQLESVRAILLELESELTGKREAYTLEVQSLLLRLFAVLTREKAGPPSRQAEERRKLLAVQMTGYIADHYKLPFRMEEMVRYFHFSRSYLHRIFKQETGIAILEYLTHYRINRAKELLEADSMPLIEVAVTAGFQDLSYFCRSFKRQTGVPPGRYRKLHRQGGR